jgi:penicillin-binding protein 1A
MRNETFHPAPDPYGPDGAPLELTDGLAPAGSYSTNLPVAYRRFNWWRWIRRALLAFVLLFIAAVAWLAVTAPLSKSLEPPAPPSITLLSAEGTPIARRGAIIADPVDVTKLPAHVEDAFLAIEDRRFRSHWGIDPRGIARAMVHNIGAGGMRQGGSTITQQLAKNAFLDSDRTAARKFQELLISFWLEAWLSKDEILSRYLSNVYFGDNVYGLRAAAKHYFSRPPEELTVGQAALLAGLVKAPSRLAPTQNLKGAQARQKLVVAAMVDAGVLDADAARGVLPAKLRTATIKPLPNGTYFADWVLPAARDRAGEIANDQTVQTTLETRMQLAAERAVRRAGLRKTQVAIVAMRPDGRVIAMVGGKKYADSPFNRATQARRQPGSTFKLFVYLAALRSGMDPDTLVDDSPFTISGWSPKNSDGRYLGEISLRQAFARSSNVAASRLTAEVGPKAVIRAARDLGISTPIDQEASIALGTSTVSLLELTAAYAAIANGEMPVRPRGLAEVKDSSWLAMLREQSRAIGARELDGMRELLAASVSGGTGRQAALSVQTFGKTGTTQDNRDALFVGFAGGIVTGVWLGNDDNTPNPGLAGGGIPARIWRDFMTDALGIAPEVRAAPEADVEDADSGNLLDELSNGLGIEIPPIKFEGNIGGRGLNLRVGRDGSIDVSGPDDRPEPRDLRRRERLPPPDVEDEEEY